MYKRVCGVVAGSRAKEPFDTDRARGALLHATPRRRTAIHSQSARHTSRSQAGQHAA